MRKNIIRLLIPTAMILFSLGCARQELFTGGDVRSQIAEAYGIQSLGRVHKLQYTFNQKTGDQTLRRFWIWEPNTDRVIFKGNGYQEAVSYARKDLATSAPATVRQIDQWFIHDSYWLLLPFRLAWDHHAEVADMGLCKSPISGESARCVNVVYPASVHERIIGDTYKLFLDGDYRILESIYQPETDPHQAEARRWTKHRLVGPIVLALDRENRRGRTTLWFTGVGVQLEGDSKWYWAD